MAYTSQGLIQAADYNGFASTTSGANVNNVWSTGSTDSGWGQTALATVSTSATTGGIASVTLATAGVLTVTSGTYAVGQQIEVTGTFSAGSISGYTTGTRYYIIAVNSATSITISATPSGSAVTSTAGTATPGATFTITGPASFVTATQWASLVNTISSMASQTGTTITARVAPVAGNTINILAALNTDLTNITNNRQNAVANGTQFTGWTGTNSLTGGRGAGAWSITFTNTVTWASADAARYFFNAGGRIKIDVSKTATGATGDPEWNDLANTLCGDIFITGGTATQTIAGASYTGTTKVGGTGAPNILLTTTGWYDLTAGAAATIVYKQFADTAPYTANFIQHSIAKGASSNTLVITTLWSASDGDPITGGTASSGATPGTAPTTIVTYFPPSTTYLSASWGTPTVAATTA
jgi:hypothetical protein